MFWWLCSCFSSESSNFPLLHPLPLHPLLSHTLYPFHHEVALILSIQKNCSHLWVFTNNPLWLFRCVFCFIECFSVFHTGLWALWKQHLRCSYCSNQDIMRICGINLGKCTISGELADMGESLGTWPKTLGIPPCRNLMSISDVLWLLSSNWVIQHWETWFRRHT
jgi:hypothetical protein